MVATVSRGGYRGPVAPHVRLFVQNEGPPKCVYRYHGPPHSGANPTFMSPNQLRWFRHATRWWLVECVSAKTGRDCIYWQDVLDEDPRSEFAQITRNSRDEEGRILARSRP